MCQDLTLHEQIIIMAIWMVRDNAYGVAIREKAMEITGRNLHYGTLYNTLAKLANKGLISPSRGEPTSERGGRSKIFYTITPPGLKALDKAKELQKSLWQVMKGFGYEQ